jgi:hypothetical protein
MSWQNKSENVKKKSIKGISYEYLFSKKSKKV